MRNATVTLNLDRLTNVEMEILGKIVKKSSTNAENEGDELIEMETTLASLALGSSGEKYNIRNTSIKDYFDY